MKATISLCEAELTMSVRAIKTRMDRLLRPLGFAVRSATWNRKAGSFVDVVSVEVSKARDTATISAGVVDRDVHALLWGPPALFIQEPLCTVRVRIGELIDNYDRWWEVDDVTTPDAMADDTAASVLPFLERMHSRESLRQWLISTKVTTRRYPPPIIGLAILEALLGNPGKGRAILAELQKNTLSMDWGARAARVADQLPTS